MKTKLCIIFCFISIIFLNCSPQIAKNLTSQTKFQQPDEIKTIENLQNTINILSKCDFNINRQNELVELILKNHLDSNTSLKSVDRYTNQHNILIEIKGETDKIIYIIAHYDKTVMSPLSLLNAMLNGSLAETEIQTLSEGAIDNGTGVSVAFELAKTLKTKKMKYTYRILLTAAEEDGLRGARTYVATLPNSQWEKVLFAINIDCVGVKNSDNCILIPNSDSILQKIALKEAEKLGFTLKTFKFMGAASGDHEAFEGTSFKKEFLRSLRFNLLGAFLPQRCYTGTRKNAKPTITFCSNGLLQVSDIVSGILMIPIGTIHSPRDNTSKIDYEKLFEQYKIIYQFLLQIEGN